MYLRVLTKVTFKLPLNQFAQIQPQFTTMQEQKTKSTLYIRNTMEAHMLKTQILIRRPNHIL